MEFCKIQRLENRIEPVVLRYYYNDISREGLQWKARSA